MGRAWLCEQILPGDERLAVERRLREFDRLTDDLKVIERDLAQSALADDRATRLMTIPGINMVVALALIAAIGDIKCFAKAEQLVGYLGLNPSVRQSGPGPAYHGRITKQGRGHARGMLVEAGWVAARCPGPLRSFFLRVQSRRGQHVAAVATARKLAILIWHPRYHAGPGLRRLPDVSVRQRTPGDGRCAAALARDDLQVRDLRTALRRRQIGDHRRPAP
jgi:transposase